METQSFEGVEDFWTCTSDGIFFHLGCGQIKNVRYHPRYMNNKRKVILFLSGECEKCGKKIFKEGGVNGQGNND